MRKPSMKQAEWIFRNMHSFDGFSADDVFDTLTGTITSPSWFVEDVKYYALQYEEDLERHNIKIK